MVPHRSAPVRVCLVDMNNGVENQAIRCFRVLLHQFEARVRERNPDIDFRLTHVQPRNLGEVVPPDSDLVVSSGGPGSPYDGYDEPWATNYRKSLDAIVEEQLANGDASPAAVLVCHSFEIAVMHFGVARMDKSPARKFGVMPVYMTERGMRSPLLTAFGDRLFAFEHRYWHAIGLENRRLGELGGELWARESRDGKSKGEGLLSFRFAPGVEGTQFHPEADRAGAVAWIARPEQAAAFVEAYGELTYRRMQKTLDNPMRLARTFALLIPGWLARRFNALALARGWHPIELPRHDPKSLGEFGNSPEAKR